MKLLFLSLTFLLSQPTFAYQYKDPDIGYHFAYRQTELKRTDPQGDFSLVKRYGVIFQWLIEAGLGDQTKAKELLEENKSRARIYVERGDFPSSEGLMKLEETQPRRADLGFLMDDSLLPQEKEVLWVQYLNSQSHIEGHKNPLKKKQMVEMFNQVLWEEQRAGLTPRRGQFHEWSPEFLSDYGDEYYLTNFSKLLAALGAGLSYLYLYTGQEEALRDWALTQDYQTIEPAELFRQSYRLNQGDVYLALLTIENLLSYQWRNSESRRNQFDVIQRLSMMANFYENRGDKYGAWYHCFGLMVYGYAKGPVRARFMGGLESWMSHFHHRSDETQEDYINAQCGWVGGQLRKSVDQDQYLKQGNHPEYLQVDRYLDLNEDFRDRIYFYNSLGFGRIKATEWSLSGPPGKNSQSRKGTRLGIWVERRGPSLHQCQVEVIPQKGLFRLNWMKTKQEIDFPEGSTVYIDFGRIRHRSPQAKDIHLRLVVSGCMEEKGEFQLTTEPSQLHISEK